MSEIYGSEEKLLLLGRTGGGLAKTQWSVISRIAVLVTVVGVCAVSGYSVGYSVQSSSAVTTALLMTPTEFNEAALSEQFSEFMAYASEWEKTYASLPEDDSEVQLRFSYFQENMQVAADLSAADEASGGNCIYGVTKFSDFSGDEIDAIGGFATSSIIDGNAGEVKVGTVTTMNLLGTHIDRSGLLKGLGGGYDHYSDSDQHRHANHDGDKSGKQQQREQAFENDAADNNADMALAASRVPLTDDQIAQSNAGSETGIVDWRGTLTTKYILDQGDDCFGCWAISATNQVESDGIRNGIITPDVNLSPQAEVSCDTMNNGCHGGAPPLAYDFMFLTGGAVSATDYDDVVYSQALKTHHEADQCKFNDITNLSEAPRAVKPMAYFKLHSEDEMISHLTNTGPLSVCLYSQPLLHYNGGVISQGCHGEPDHCVQLVGINNDISHPYYIVRNSWGKDWGIDGYAYIAAGKGLCSIDLLATFVDAGPADTE